MSISMVAISKVSIPMASISMMTISKTTIVSISFSISISTTLATGNMLEGVSSWVKLVNSVNSSIVRKTKRKSITISPGITIAIGQVSWLGIGLSATLAVVEGRTATKTGGGRVRGGHSWPVRVGIEQGRGPDQVAWVSRGGGGHGQAGGNQKLRHV